MTVREGTYKMSRCMNCGNNLINNQCPWCGRVYEVIVKKIKGKTIISTSPLPYFRI